MNRNIIITEKIHKVLILLLIVLSVIYTYNMMKVVEKKGDAQIKEIEKANVISQQREKIAEKERDNAEKHLNQSQAKIIQMQRLLEEQSIQLNRMETSYANSLNELKKLQNEKNYIPTATIDEQFDFIANYKYSEY